MTMLKQKFASLIIAVALSPLAAGVAMAAGDCSAAASRVVAETGGQLLSVSAGDQGGRAVCTVTVLVQDSGSERPRKVTVSVPQ